MGLGSFDTAAIQVADILFLSDDEVWDTAEPCDVIVIALEWREYCLNTILNS